MSRTVEEVMNREVFTVLPEERADDAIKYLLSFGITGCPVIGAEGQPIGQVSLRDLVGVDPLEAVGDHMTSPARTISKSETVSEAGRRLAAQGLHRLIVTGDDDRVLGVVSAVDVIRGLLGLPIRHPAAFPHLDARYNVSWSNELPLDLRAVDAMPEGGGVLTLVYGAPAEPDRVVWAEDAAQLGKRFIDMLSAPQTPPLSRWIETPHVRVRVASVADTEQRARLASRLRRLMPTSVDIVENTSPDKTA